MFLKKKKKRKKLKKYIYIYLKKNYVVEDTCSYAVYLQNSRLESYGTIWSQFRKKNHEECLLV